jgi:Ser/Thr protein kinase RdoA (MazF antagonist)
LLKNVGTSLADFNQVMKNFHHPAAVRDHRWNLVHAGRHRGGLKGVEPVEKRLMLQQAFDEFSAVETGLNRLPFQFIHGDANRENILVEGERVSGLVDFGDCLENPVVCELAIGLVYLMMDSDRPLENAAAVVRGYHERRPLDDGELAMLYPLACARLAVSLSIAARRRAIDPGHPNWFSSEASAWRLLAFLQKAGPGTFRNQVLP